MFHINKIKGKTQSKLNECKKKINEIQYPFLIKTLNQLEVEVIPQSDKSHL